MAEKEVPNKIAGRRLPVRKMSVGVGSPSIALLQTPNRGDEK